MQQSDNDYDLVNTNANDNDRLVNHFNCNLDDYGNESDNDNKLFKDTDNDTDAGADTDTDADSASDADTNKDHGL